MPIPSEYQRVTEQFYAFLNDAKAFADLGSTHQTYTMVQGVFQTFRRRLDFHQAILFANVLPPVLRAIFVADWDTHEPQKPFEDRESMTKDVRSLRPTHNFSPDTAIQDVARALRRHVHKEAFDDVLKKMPDGAKEFWAVR